MSPISSSNFVMKIPKLSLRTTLLFILISLAHVASLLNLNFYTPKPESKIVDTNQLQLQENNTVAIALNLRNVENSILPSVKEDSKTQKEINFAEFRPGSDESSSLIGANKKIATLLDKIDKNLKGPHPEVEANYSASKIKKESTKIKKESTLSGTTARVKKSFINYFAENNGKKYPIYVYYGGYDMNSKPVGKGFLSYKFNSADSNYKIELFAEAMGWAKIFLRRPIFFSSKGYVSGMILKPTSYETHTPKRGKSYVEVAQASNLITFSGKTYDERFFGNIYDPLSLIFQIASYSKNGQIFNKENSKTFQVFNRKKLEEIQLNPLPPEEMILPNGDFITAVKIISRVERGGKKGDISFWLDTSYDHHPV
ncbi:DUF3108 domain-containing protein, partial [Betaproteobacteria bacterium]|nr:DUF3108 domain-containing protein [Betaproteobacteria bacterium]